MATIKIDGAEIFYEVFGEGEYLLLVHHGLGCTKMWEPLIPEFAKRYRIVLYDRRGFGRSDSGENFPEYYISNQYCDSSVKELSAILDELNINKVNIVGQCEGGVIAFHYALRNPDRVKTIITSSTQCFSEVKMTELVPVKFPLPFAELPAKLQKQLINWHGKSRAQELYHLFRKGGGAYGREKYDIRNILPKIHCPTLVLYGDRSHLFNVEQAVAMYNLLPKGELAVLPNCGHNTYEERPQEYQKQVLDFLFRVSQHN